MNTTVTRGKTLAHANHNTSKHYDFINDAFGSHSLARQAAAEKFLETATIDTTKAEATDFARTKPLWKGRGEMMGTVTSTHFTTDGEKIDIYITTDSDHKEVHIKNY
ncbi:hypothetical protein [Psychromonas aquimarina]|uniref:hypothetical protein n=1 Tax=Psychromonas aquimarina TaxID=444919 RepID=UPI00040BACE4|nr:hypothetical protein [Psychromonas aquimarina]